ncbi:putative membrane protein [Anaplasma phagocytophilum str. ApMUC09]|uniref:Putative membrane protein n=1 Tax=Anaplasma phagocytophilum str. ApMUC09 TaxID=1359152 RepID=A0A0F3N8I0_ANAPH|nr:putative membrane protein [Anaplasma phagocytophilum str. ApMUC09]
MRMLLMYSSAVMLLMVYRSFITACRIALLACMVGMVCVDEDELRGWNTGSPFVGVSVSMLCCLVMFLFCCYRWLYLLVL